MGPSGMISARDFQKMTSVWSELTPFLEPYTRKVVKSGTGYAPGVEQVDGTPSTAAFIAELGFRLAADRISNKTVPDSRSLQDVVSSLSELPGYEPSKAANTQPVIDEARAICNNIVRYINRNKSMVYVFHPIIPGCGVVDETTADILGGEEIIEVKSVLRSFQSADLRQLLTYAGLLSASGRSIKKVTLLNPRRGRQFSSSLSDLSYNISGLSAVELMYGLQQIMQGMQVSV
jgi:hypothetical protein